MPRIQAIQHALADAGLDAILISKPENRRYAAGFTGTAGTAVISTEHAWFITDFRYAAQAEQQCPGFETVVLKSSEKLESWLQDLPLKRMGFEANHWSVADFMALKAAGNLEFIPAQQLLSDLRLIKDRTELDAVSRAAGIADQAFQYIMGFIRPGVSEQEVALELEFFMRKAGATDLSFDSIVASGLRSAMPHGVASDKLIEHGDLVTLDYGCIVDGYCSDMTRTVVVGKADEEQRKLYRLVLDAQLASLEQVAAGAVCADVDRAGRRIIEAAGYGSNFGHGTGHGVGLEIHEEPRIAPNVDVVLKPGMVVTVEPGVYLDGFGGVRIEDLVAVTEYGSDVLSKSPKELIEL